MADIFDKIDIFDKVAGSNPQQKVSTGFSTNIQPESNNYLDKMIVTGGNLGGVNLKNIGAEKTLQDINLEYAVKEYERKKKIDQDYKKIEATIKTDGPAKDSFEKIKGTNLVLDILDKIEAARSKTSVGPIYSKVFDAGFRKFDKEGNEVAPGFVNSIISSLNPEETKNLRMLNQQLERLFDYISSVGGKQLTSTEKGSVLGQFPGIYEKPEVFDEVLKKSKQNIKELQENEKNFLIGIGNSPEAIQKLIDNKINKKIGVKDLVNTNKQDQSSGLNFDVNAIEQEIKRRGGQ